MYVTVALCLCGPGFKRKSRVHKVDLCEKEDDQLTVQLNSNLVQAFGVSMSCEEQIDNKHELPKNICYVNSYRDYFVTKSEEKNYLFCAFKRA